VSRDVCSSRRGRNFMHISNSKCWWGRALVEHDLLPISQNLCRLQVHWESFDTLFVKGLLSCLCVCYLVLAEPPFSVMHTIVDHSCMVLFCLGINIKQERTPLNYTSERFGLVCHFRFFHLCFQVILGGETEGVSINEDDEVTSFP
jgi:hypothetical protein